MFVPKIRSGKNLPNLPAATALRRGINVTPINTGERKCSTLNPCKALNQKHSQR